MYLNKSWTWNENFANSAGAYFGSYIYSHILSPKHDADSLPVKSTMSKLSKKCRSISQIIIRIVFYLKYTIHYFWGYSINYLVYLWILLWFIKTEFSLTNSSWKFERLSLQIILKRRWWNLLILLNKEREWNIQTIGQ